MWVVHQRLAELTLINKKRPLTESEVQEMAECLTANANRAWQIARLENLSLVASMVGDTEWQHQICSELEKIDTE